MKSFHLSLHLISSTADGYYDQNGLPFDSLRYSMFKYGCHASAESYALRMAQMIRHEFPHWRSEEVMMAGSAFKVAPTASEAIANLVYVYLKPFFPLLQKIKIRRDSIFPNDYGSLSIAERESLMNRNILWIDEDSLRGKKLIVVDDLRVTGAHEKKITQLVEKSASEVLFCYVGRLVGSYQPSCEAHINQSAVGSLADLKDIIRRGHFHVNARVCKYVLSYGDATELSHFLSNVPEQVLSTLDLCIQGDGYHLMTEYMRNYEILRSALVHHPAMYSYAV